MNVVVDIQGMRFSFDDEEGWQAAGQHDPHLLAILQDLWLEKFGAERALYPLSIAGLHLRAVLAQFAGKVVQDNTPTPPQPTDPEVVY